MNEWHVYLSGEIHTDWREQIAAGARAADLPVTFSSSVTDHEASDNCAVAIGSQVERYSDTYAPRTGGYCRGAFR